MDDDGPDAVRLPRLREVDVDRLTFVKTAQRLGLTLDEIKEILAFRDRGEQPCGYVADVLHRQVADLDRRIAEMRTLRDELRALGAKAGAATATPGTFCGVIEHARVADRRLD